MDRVYPISRGEVFRALNTERAYQDSRWNASTTTSAGTHSFSEWIAYMEDYLAEAKHILARNAEQVANPQAADIMRKVTAMGVACMEQLGAPYRKGFEQEANPFRDKSAIYKNPNCTIDHEGSSCNIACGE